MSKLEEITEQALALEPLERSHLLDSLTASLSPEYLCSIEKAWLEEAKSRIAAFERGELESYSLEEVKLELNAE